MSNRVICQSQNESNTEDETDEKEKSHSQGNDANKSFPCSKREKQKEI
jgi:hypothetical protein